MSDTPSVVKASHWLTVGAATVSTLILACSGPPRYVAGAGIWDEPETAAGARRGASDGETERRWKDICADVQGVPYRPGGGSLSGFDCSGLVQFMYREYDGRRLPRTVDAMYAQGHSVARGGLKPGDLLFYETNGRGPSHVGVYLGERKFVHAAASSGVTVSSVDETYYRDRYIGARRLVD